MKFKDIMFKNYIIVSVISILICFTTHADRILIMNSPGYNSAGNELIAAMTSIGHTVTNNTTNLTTFPPGFTTTCMDAVNGYDWLCFFGNNDFSMLQTGIQQFVDNGGKVFYQYEVDCCVTSATAAGQISSGLTGLDVMPSSDPYISFALGPPAWESVNCCVTITGAAYRCMNGVPVGNQLLATADLNGGTPSYTTCPVFGFAFFSADMSSGQNKGGIIGIGDVNIWYDGGEPWSNGGSGPVNIEVVKYFFPNSTTSCSIFPPGCSNQPILPTNSGAGDVSLGPDQGICPGQQLILDAGSQNSSFLWQDNSTQQTYEVTAPGLYWVEVVGSCGPATDSIEVYLLESPMVDLGNDLNLCQDSSLLISATIENETSYQWQDNSITNPYEVFSPGIYWLEATNDCGTFRDSVIVSLLNPSFLDLGEDQVLCEGQTIILGTTFPNANYLWSTGSNNATISIGTAGEYSVLVIVDNCPAQDTVNISTEECLVSLEMPNVFTPNGDATNDKFIPVTMVGINSAEIVIINRWGNTVYVGSDISVGWDGRSDGKECVDGTYFWKVTYTDQFDFEKVMNGFVVLER